MEHTQKSFVLFKFTPYIGAGLNLQDYTLNLSGYEINLNKNYCSLRLGGRFKLEKNAYLDLNIQKNFRKDFLTTVNFGHLVNPVFIKIGQTNIIFNVGLLVNF